MPLTFLFFGACTGWTPSWTTPNQSYTTFFLPQEAVRTAQAPRGGAESLRAEEVEEQTRQQEQLAQYQAQKVLHIQLEQSSDYGLALLRTPEYRQRVIDFYAEETSSEAIALYILEGAQANEIPLSLAFALAWMESRYNPGAVNHNSSSVDRGLFQLNSRSFPTVSVEEFFDPSLNSRLGLEYLRQCLDAGETEIVALAMYNAGRTRVSRGDAADDPGVHLPDPRIPGGTGGAVLCPVFQGNCRPGGDKREGTVPFGS